MPTPNDTPRTVQEAAQYFINRGWQPVPLRPGEKAARDKGYRTREYTAADFGTTDNIGVKLGYQSGHLVDGDLDHPTMEDLAPEFLPPTGAICGRGARNTSHWLYRLIDGVLPPKTDFDSAPDSADKTTHYGELRYDNHFTRFPPSRDASGEFVTWHADGEPAGITAEALLAAMGRLAAATAVVEAWGATQNQHHKLMLAVAGGMHRGGVAGDVIVHFVETVAAAACGKHDGAVADHRRAAESTIAKDPDQSPLTAWKTVAGLLGWPLTTKLIRWLAPDGDDRVEIYTRADIATLGDLTLAALHAANDPLQLFTGPSGAVARLQHRPESGLDIVTLSPEAMQDETARRVKIVKPAKEENAPADEITTPMPLVKNLLSRADPGFPELTRILRAPTFTAGGALVAEPGYHADLRAFLDLPEDLALPVWAFVNPDAAQITAARTLLVDTMLGEFPFDADADRANAVALLLEPFGRKLITGSTPQYGIVKPKAGTGGSLLAEVLTIPYAGGERGATKLSEPRDDAEMRKLILSMAIAGAGHFFVDNLGRRLDSPVLAMAVTAGTITDRVLGLSRTATVQIDWTWLFTANNADVSDEHARRIVPIRLDAKAERPEERTDFKLSLPGWAVEHRRDLIIAALTLWQAWLQKGRPAGTATLGGFENWARVLGGVLAVAGIPGFLSNRRAFADHADSDSQLWRAVVTAWLARHGTKPVPAGDVYLLAPVQEGIAFKAQSEQGRRVAFGKMLKARLNNQYAECRIVSAGEDTATHVPTYRLEPLNGEERDGNPTAGERKQENVFDIGEAPSAKARGGSAAS